MLYHTTNSELVQSDLDAFTFSADAQNEVTPLIRHFDFVPRVARLEGVHCIVKSTPEMRPPHQSGHFDWFQGWLD